jgi:cytochrome c-type biogenesis protein
MATPQSEIQQSERQQISAHEERPLNKRMLLFGGLVAAAVFIIAVLSLSSGGNVSYVTGGASVLVLAIPAFLAGLFSFLSPCTLPILPAYFAFTFQAQRQSIVLMTVAFFLGLATTMTLLGATATAVSTLLFQNLDALTFWGGMLVIVFGIMSLFGKGFAGPQVQERPAASMAGSYLYGATFALGWTACVGPILGALLTLLASQGVSIVQGGVLAFIYAMGLGMPLILLATFFSRLGSGSRFWQFMRGKGFEVKIGSRTLYLHTTSIASGVLLILMGWLLASGQLSALTEWATSTPLSQWVIDLEEGLNDIFGLY